MHYDERKHSRAHYQIIDIQYGIAEETQEMIKSAGFAVSKKRKRIDQTVDERCGY
jgi:hypothetical protein